MRVAYDSQTDAAYIYLVDELQPGEVVRTYTCDPGEVGEINLDFDREGRLVGVEVLNASKKLHAAVLARARS